MTASSPASFTSSILNIPNSKTSSFILNPNPFPQIKVNKSRNPKKPTGYFISKSVTVDNPTTVSSSSSLNLDEGVDEKSAEAIGKVGSRVRVTVPLKVYHVPKVPELDLVNRIGTLKQYVGFHKGKQISANLPYKVEFVVANLEGRDGSVKFLAHLKEDEFEFLD
ncbi:ferredoxin-thioredoxin reductase, variable chain-like [Nicotiana tabacum]|uniref:Ferredoxin-thioredoxin reductase, variable chain-like n=1 Tax=Nicotiana tabacum TaxID=4097 RepID=A0A1S4B5N2_TOBAC|nr:PREDICTED: ferredoxin-thioredoxin reductase, variable chain-like [Nicotiana tabacum]